jgi:hypothetical protein
MGLLSSLYTGSGYWNPLAWVLAIAVTAAVVYVIWRRGESSYKKGTMQTTSFISGNPEQGKGLDHIPASNLYWGYTEGIKGYYDRIVPLHTGITTDYLLWIFWVTGILLIVVMVI